MMEAAIRSLLLADSAVTTLVGTRICPLVLPQKPTLPAITYQRISGQTQYTHDGPALARPRVQIDCWASDYDTAKSLAAAAAAVLSGFKGISSGVEIEGVFSAGCREFYEAETRPAPLYRVSSDYFIWLAAPAA
jgi:Protein of unknown function (DUF3168)